MRIAKDGFPAILAAQLMMDGSGKFAPQMASHESNPPENPIPPSGFISENLLRCPGRSFLDSQFLKHQFVLDDVIVSCRQILPVSPIGF